MKRFLVLALLLPTTAFAQLISYESFADMPKGAGVAGSGSNASGWTDAGWSGGSDARFQLVDPTPDLTHQLNGGPLVHGANRAVQLTTSPEPVPASLIASRSIPPQNTTFYVSFLVRPVGIGTGSDTIDLRLTSGTTLLGRVAFKPDQGQQYMRLEVPIDTGSGGGGGSIPALYAGQTYFVVMRVTRPSANSIGIAVQLNPPATYNGNFNYSITQSISGNPTIDRVGLSIASTDTGGPATTLIFDEIRVGYTWIDVVPPGPPPETVPDLTISSAVKLRWQTQSGKTYQPQYSYDLSTWYSLGSVISGNGQAKEIFDSTESDAKKFFRVQIQ